jgi:hypothetical protein
MTLRAMTILNDRGDQTIVWDESSDEFWIEVIRKKMAEGIVFFAIEPRFFGLLPPRKTALKTAEESLKHRAVTLSDQDMARLIADGKGDVVRTPDAPAQTVRKVTDPVEAAKTETVAVKPMRGG